MNTKYFNKSELTRLRVLAKLTPKQISELSKEYTKQPLSVRVLYAYEKGERVPIAENLYVLSLIFGVPMETFFRKEKG